MTIIIQKQQEVYCNTIWDEPALTDAGAVANFHTANNCASFKFKQKKITGEMDPNGRKNVEIMVSLKYLSNFWRTFEMLLVNYEINLILTWSEKYIIWYKSNNICNNR